MSRKIPFFLRFATVTLPALLIVASCAPKRDTVPLVKVDEPASINTRDTLPIPEPTPPPYDRFPQPGDAGRYPDDRGVNIPSGSNRLPPPTTATSAPRYPWGRKIAGRPGFVLSPHAPDQGIVDVTDPTTGQPYPRGTEVQCPFTNRIFLVP